MPLYEVWSISTGNRYAEAFSEWGRALAVLRLSQEAWPEDEFVIVAYEDDDAD